MNSLLADIRYLVSKCNNQNNEIFIEISHWFAKSGKTRAFCFKIASLGHALFFSRLLIDRGDWQKMDHTLGYT